MLSRKKRDKVGEVEDARRGGFITDLTKIFRYS